MLGPLGDEISGKQTSLIKTVDHVFHERRAADVPQLRYLKCFDADTVAAESGLETDVDTLTPVERWSFGVTERVHRV